MKVSKITLQKVSLEQYELELMFRQILELVQKDSQELTLPPSFIQSLKTLLLTTDDEIVVEVARPRTTKINLEKK